MATPYTFDQPEIEYPRGAVRPYTVTAPRTFITPSGLAVGVPFVASWCTRGTSWLLAQFADKPDMRAYLCAVLDEVQALEQAVADVQYVHLDLRYAFGKSLDDWGELLAYRRDGQTDTQYRLELQAVAAARVGNSSVVAVVDVFAALLGVGTFQQVELYPAHYRVFADDPLPYDIGGRYASVGRLAKPAAVGYDFNYVPEGYDIMSFSDDVVHPAVPVAERGSGSNTRVAERTRGV